MKFETKKMDLELDLTTLSGENVLLEPKKLITAEETISILEKWTTLEGKVTTNVGRVKLVAAELSVVYHKDESWFMSNFDISTLNEILNYVAETLGGIRKNAESSN